MLTATKTWTKDEILSLIKTNDKMVIRSVLKLYDYQTDREKLNMSTGEENGVGFNKYDSPFLTSIAQQIKKNYQLTTKQINVVRKKLLKYAGQLTRIANYEI